MDPSFEWDPAKDAENQRKHGVSFAEAQAASLVPGTGAEARNCMKSTRKYTNEPLGRIEMVEDFLPPPDQFVLREDGVKVTISLSKKSVDFFKAHAAQSKVPYQRMIRTLLDSYADKYSQRPLTSRPLDGGRCETRVQVVGRRQ
jgi:hypothetical protein